MFEDLRDQISERASQLNSRIQESDIFITIKERYDNLSPNAQKALGYGSVAIIVLFLLSFPLGFIGSAEEQIESVQADQELVLQLIQTKTKANSSPSLPPSMTTGALQSRLRSILDRERILPEQIVSVGIAPDKPKFIPKGATSAFVEAKLSKLNLRQIISLGHSFQQMHVASKITDLMITPNPENDHYFDVTYKLLSFGPPERMKPPPPKKKNNDKKRNRGKKRNNRKGRKRN